MDANINRVAGKHIALTQPICLNRIGVVIVVPLCLLFSVDLIFFVSVVVVSICIVFIFFQFGC